MLHAYLLAALAVLALMLALWFSSLALKDASIVDRFWGAGFVVIAWVLYTVRGPASPDQNLLTAIVSVWGLRLSLYIHLRNRGHAEDYRYREMRAAHGNSFWWYSLFSVFLLQGALMLIVSAPLVFVLSREQTETLSPAAVLGTVVWLIGFVFEAGGDWQLSRFKKNPANRGKLLTTGLWSLTRHPNYFGDACQWWGFGIFAFSTIPNGLFTFIGPIVMTLFIRKVSGVDLLEKSLKTEKPGYAAYAANVPPFFPRLKFWQPLLVLFLASGLSSIGKSDTAAWQNELPYSQIDFKVFDLKSKNVISEGSEKITYEGESIDKSTVYYSTSTNRQVIQTERSVVVLKNLEVKDYEFFNKVTGEKATLAKKDESAVMTYQKSDKDQPKTKTVPWSSKAIIGKTLHHFIVRQWGALSIGKDAEFELLLPMKGTSYGFRVRLVRTYDHQGQKRHVVSLEPSNWAIRALVPQMDFHYAVIQGVPRLEYYEGATVVAVDGNDDRVVGIDFSYIPTGKPIP